MLNNGIATCFLSVSLAFSLLTCASLDHLLKVSSSSRKRPTVIFECNFFTDNTDTLIILAMRDATVIARGPKGPTYQNLEFYLKSTNEKLIMSNSTNRRDSNFLLLSPLCDQTLSKFRRHFNELEDMQAFVIHLKRLTVDKEKLSSYKILKDGHYKDIHNRNEELISQRKILFVIKDLDKIESEIWKDIIDNNCKVEVPRR